MKPPNPYRTGTQLHRLYEALSCQPQVLNVEIVRDLGIFSYHGKISEIRRYLEERRCGCMLVAERLTRSGIWKYRMVKEISPARS
jgi:hypothetical protein